MDETGISPVRELSARSNQERLAKLPIDGGILPWKLFEFSDLQVPKNGHDHQMNRIAKSSSHHIDKK